MNLRKYQEAVLNGNLVHGEVLHDQYSRRLLHSILGLCGESGEVADLVKKAMQDGNEGLNVPRIVEELSDVLWFLTSTTALLGYDIEELASINYNKLSERHPTLYPVIVE